MKKIIIFKNYLNIFNLLYINNRSLFVLVVVSLFFGLFTSCITASYCRNINTYQQGYLDALRGKMAKSFNKTIRSCAEYKVRLNVKKYNKGWIVGLKKFCTYKRGYQFGSTGGEYQDICPKNLEVDFFKGYTLGLQEYAEEAKEEAEEAKEEARRATEGFF